MQWNRAWLGFSDQAEATLVNLAELARDPTTRGTIATFWRDYAEVSASVARDQARLRDEWSRCATGNLYCALPTLALVGAEDVLQPPEYALPTTWSSSLDLPLTEHHLDGGERIGRTRGTPFGAARASE